jgi:hypothetical protein
LVPTLIRKVYGMRASLRLRQAINNARAPIRYLAHQTFTDIAALDQTIHDAVIDLNREHTPRSVGHANDSLLRRPIEARDHGG